MVRLVLSYQHGGIWVDIMIFKGTCNYSSIHQDEMLAPFTQVDLLGICSLHTWISKRSRKHFSSLLSPYYYTLYDESMEF